MSNKQIETVNGTYFFEEKYLQTGGAKINKKISEDNLLIFSEVLNSRKLDFYLIFGTLLGAVREGDFIEYDEDIDVCIKYAELDNLKSLLFVLREKGLEVIRFTGELLSLERKGDYIDIYLFRHEKGKSWRCLGYEFPEKFFLTTEKINFLGYDFGCPKDKFEFLEICYGGDWKIPIVGKHARAVKNIWIRENIIPILPLWLKNTLKAVNRYLKGF